MSYSGFLKAGTATLELKETTLDEKKYSMQKGMVRLAPLLMVFKVSDTYESYFDTEIPKPYFLKRDVNEGGYTIKRDTKFDYETACNC